jgi:pSer/pThr/pTyr-binding forkhead associated (FHA) protein
MQIQVLTEGKPIRLIQLRAGTYSFGRSTINSIRLEDKFVSRVHFNIVYYPNQSIVLEELGSMNGTNLNCVRVTGTIPLKIGDEISVGKSKILVVPAPAPSIQVSERPEYSIEIPKTSLVKKTTSFLLWISVLIAVGILTFIIVFVIIVNLDGTLTEEEKNPNKVKPIEQKRDVNT